MGVCFGLMFVPSWGLLVLCWLMWWGFGGGFAFCLRISICVLCLWVLGVCCSLFCLDFVVF